MRSIFITIIWLGCLVIQTEAAYTGRVFIDKNKNGVLDRDEKGLEDVMVSDGLHVVKTFADGSFRLPGHEKERFIFITTPSGYKTDNSYYQLINPGKPSYNFALQSYDRGIQKDGSHRFIHITDTEIFNTDRQEDWVNDVRNYAQNEEAAFIIHTGDICYEKGLKEHIGLMNSSNMGCQIFYCIGNHDLTSGQYGEELFEKLYGPVFYSFDTGNTHYIVIPMMNGDHQPSYTKEDIYRWLINDLRHVPLGKPILIFNHDLMTTGETFKFGISDTEVIDLDAHNLKAWIYGHWHINFMRKQGNVYTISTAPPDKGGIDHSPNSFRVVDVGRNGNISSQLRYTYLNKHIEIASPGTDGSPVFTSGSMPLTVNTYHSASPTREVVYTCSADGKKLFSNRKLIQYTDWTWKDVIYLNAQQKGKIITLKITATFNNGEKAEKEIRFPYTGRKSLTSLKENWNNLLGTPDHRGVAASVIDSPLTMAWTNNIGANIHMTSPVLYKGKVFIASADEDLKGKSFIYALNGQTGEILWKYYVDNSIKNTIVVENDLVFAQTAQGTLYAIKTDDGSLKWGKQLHVNPLPALVEGLVVSDGIIYAGTGNGLCALNAITGQRIWENEDWQQVEGTTSTLTLGNGILIGSAQWKGLYGNDIHDGRQLWHLDKNGISNRAGSASIYNNLLYLVSTQSLFIIDPLTGNVIVRREYPFSVDVTSTPLLTDKEIIFGTVDKGLVAVDRETLEIKWQFQTGDALVYTAPYTRKESATVETSPVLSGNTVYFGASDGTLYGVNKNDGLLLWKHSTGAPVLGSVAVSGNTLVAVDMGGNVYAFTGR